MKDPAKMSKDELRNEVYKLRHERRRILDAMSEQSQFPGNVRAGPLWELLADIRLRDVGQ